MKKRFYQHLENILRYWERARDDEIGGFHYYISNSGQSHKFGRRLLMIQARLLYNYAEGMLAGHEFCADHAAFLYDFIANHLRTEDGWYSSIWDQETLMSPETLAVYDNEFVVIGMARYAQASGRGDVLDEAWRLFRLLDEKAVPGDLAGDGVLGLCGMPGRGHKTSMYSGNVNLHFLEALAVLHDAGLDQDLSPWVEAMRRFFLSKILDSRRMFTFDEFIDGYDNPSRMCGSFMSLGHGLEWIDFFRCFPEYALDEDIERGLLSRALMNGVQGNGIFLDRYCPVYQRCAAEGYFWPQAEAIKTFNLAYTLYGPPFQEAARLLADAYFTFFVDEDGGVFEQVDASGVVTQRFKGSYWKCDYHSMRMCVDICCPHDLRRSPGAFDG